jgi:transcriptional regulator with XRE-family HTH domain
VCFAEVPTFHGGHQLKLARLDRSLTYRDVEHLSRILSERRADDRYTVRISALAEIENHGAVPSIFRLYTLCLIYKLDLPSVIEWFGFRPRASDRTVIEQYLRWIDRNHEYPAGA